MTENQIRRLYAFTQIIITELTHDRLSLNQELDFANNEDYLVEKFNSIINSKSQLSDIQIDSKYFTRFNIQKKYLSDLGVRIFCYSLDIMFNLKNFKDPKYFFIFIGIFEKYFFSIDKIEQSAIQFGLHQLILIDINKNILNSPTIQRELKINKILNDRIG